MRLELFYNPAILCERLAIAVQRRRRLARLRGTVAKTLKLGHINTLELLELVRPHHPRVIYDIGANAGTWTLLAKSIYPHAIVHAFEPLTCHTKTFEANTARLANVHLHKIALGAAATEQAMQVATFSDESSLLQALNTISGLEETATFENVSVVRLDDYVREKGLPLPDVLKLDVQGYELEALRGAPKCMASAFAILTEVSFHEFYKGQCLFHHMVELCASKGFYFSALGSNTPIGQRLEQTDILFLKDEVNSVQ